MISMRGAIIAAILALLGLGGLAAYLGGGDVPADSGVATRDVDASTTTDTAANAVPEETSEAPTPAPAAEETADVVDDQAGAASVETSPEPAPAPEAVAENTAEPSAAEQPETDMPAATQAASDEAPLETVAEPENAASEDTSAPVPELPETAPEASSDIASAGQAQPEPLPQAPIADSTGSFFAAPSPDTQSPAMPQAAAANELAPSAAAGNAPGALLGDIDRVSGSASAGAPPRFDVVRIDQQGGIVVAGRAEPGSTVVLRLAGQEIASVPVGANGQFVAIINAPASEAPQALQLESAMPEQAVVAAVEEFIVLPAPADAVDSTPALVRSSPEAVELVQPFAGTVENVSLDTISYSDVGAIVLTGRAQPGTAVRAYANTELLGETIVGQGGQWRLDVPGLDAGIYTLRIDEIDAEGNVTSRVESPFQRETPEAAAAQARAAEAGGQVIVQPGNTLWLLATQAYGEGTMYTQIFNANAGTIRDPDLIYPGQVFAIPELPAGQ